MNITVQDIEAIVNEYNPGYFRMAKPESHITELKRYLDPLQPKSRVLQVHELVELVKIILRKKTFKKESGRVFLNLIDRLGGEEIFNIFKYLSSHNQLNDNNVAAVLARISHASLMNLLLCMVGEVEALNVEGKSFAAILSTFDLNALNEKIFSLNELKHVKQFSLQTIQFIERVEDAKLLNSAIELLNRYGLLKDSVELLSNLSLEHLNVFFKAIRKIYKIKQDYITKETVNLLCADQAHCKAVLEAVEQLKIKNNHPRVVDCLLQLLKKQHSELISGLFLEILKAYTAADKEASFIQRLEDVQKQLTTLVQGAENDELGGQAIKTLLTDLKTLLTTLERYPTQATHYIFQIFAAINIIPLFKTNLEHLIQLRLDEELVHFVLQKHLQVCQTAETGHYFLLDSVCKGIATLSAASLVSKKNLIKLIDHHEQAEQIALALAILKQTKIDDPDVHKIILNVPEHALSLAEGLELLKANTLKLNGSRTVFNEQFKLLLAYPGKAPAISQFLNFLTKENYNWLYNNFDYPGYLDRPKRNKPVIDTLIDNIEYTLEILQFADEHQYLELSQLSKFCQTKALNTPEFVIILHALAKANLIQPDAHPNSNAVYLVKKNPQVLKHLALELDSNETPLTYERLKALVKIKKEDVRASQNPGTLFAPSANKEAKQAVKQAVESTPEQPSVGEQVLMS